MELTYPGKESKDTIISNTPLVSLKEKKNNLPENKDIVSKEQTLWKNKLIFGDNLLALKAISKNPRVSGKVKLVYIDPPFSTSRKFRTTSTDRVTNGIAYHDILIGHEYLDALRKRLIFLHKILSDDGAIYVHQDYRMVFHVKILMDEIFGDENFINVITRQKCNSKGQTRKSYGKISDYILFYSKGKNYIWNRPSLEWTEERIRKTEYRYVEKETGRLYKKVPIFGPGVRNGETGKPWRNMNPPEGKHWLWKPDKLEQLDKKGEIYWSPSGNPRRKVYLDEKPGPLAQDIWLDVKDPTNQFTANTDYPTEKSESLLERIIRTSTNKGDIVLDCYCGSGTTLLVSEKLGRKWVGIDNSKKAIETTKTRLLDNLKVYNKTNTFSYYVLQEF